jgi:hypothetical protein
MPDFYAGVVSGIRADAFDGRFWPTDAARRPAATKLRCRAEADVWIFENRVFSHGLKASVLQ